MARELGVDPALGLSEERAAALLETHGENRLRELRRRSATRILLKQLANWIAGLLAAAALASMAFGEWLDGGAILLVLALNTAIGFVTELRAVRSMEALRQLGSVRTRVRRDGRERSLPATELVPGDLVPLEAGDVVTADARLVEASKLEADESALTGESVPVGKGAEPVPAEAPLAERSSMLFKGTALTRGSALALVVATGMETELGRIARLVQEAEKGQTPIERQLARLGRKLIGVTLVIAALVSLAGIAAGEDVYLMIETAVALAVAAIPEGLPIVATLALARGLWRMARRAALVNRLAAVETLGATTVVFSDKTGTLTENRMEVRRLFVAGRRLDVAREEGGRLEEDGAPVDLASRPTLAATLEVAALCNNASLSEEKDAGLGDPMEVALLRLAADQGVEREALLGLWPEVSETAFEPETRMMATWHGTGASLRLAVKGAAEAVLEATGVARGEGGERLPWTEEERARWNEEAEAMAADGLRVLAVAERPSVAPDAQPYEELELLALLGLADPPRLEVREALAACRQAGVEVVMVTGDHAGTATAIARAVGLVEEDRPLVVQGNELAAGEVPGDCRVFARVSPEQKLDLIASWQARGHVVAMTGDGVNDAPALRKADIGVAMGQRGTQVAREAADMVLVDDSFASIVAAIEEGRVIFDNIRKFALYLLSCNASEVAVVALAILLGGPLPLLPLQILFLNLVTDVFPALALAFGAGGAGILERKPRDPGEPILTGRAWLEIVGYAFVISLAVLLALWLARSWLGYDAERAVTVSFATLALAQLWHVFDVRARGGSPWRNEVTGNPWVWGALGLCVTLLVAAVYLPGLSDVLQTRAPDARGWGIVAVASLLPLLVGQLYLTLGSRRT